jgi:hypothetical protein
MHEDSLVEPATTNIAKIVDEAEKAGVDTPHGADLYQQALDYFLDDANNVQEAPPEDDIEISRYIDGEYKTVLTVRIRTIDDAELKQLRKRSKERGPRGMRNSEAETDDLRFYTLLCAEAIVSPDLRDHRVLAKHNRPEIALERMLLPGERVSLAEHILAFSGFGESAQSASGRRRSEEIEAAKN